MPKDQLVPGALPKKKYLEPVKCPDGRYRLDRILHRRFNGTYTRSSGIGYTRQECLDNWEIAFERNRNKGTARRISKRHKFELTDPMLLAFDKYFELTQKRVDTGKITQKTCDLYRSATYKPDGPRVDPDAIRLESEMGHLSIMEAGKPVFLCEYLEDVADIVPGIAATQYQVLKGTFDMLTRAGLFDVSPMAPVTKPESAESNQRALFPAEREQLFEQIMATIVRARWFWMLYLLILGTGIRPGEAYALCWSDIPDLDDDTVEKAVCYIGATAVKPRFGGHSFRQDKRKHGRRGHGYYITLPRWLTSALREYKRYCAPKSDDAPILLSSRRRMIEPDSANYNLLRAKAGSALDWVTWGNLRDTVATHVAGRTGDPRCASAQLGHSQGATVATTHYIDPRGYVHAVVDNSDVLEELNPMKTGVKLEFGRAAA